MTISVHNAPATIERPLADGRCVETNIPKQLMCFPFHPFPEDSPLFPPHVQVLEYLRRYAEDLRSLIKLSTSVTSVTPASTGGWDVLTSASAEPTHYDAVVVATGHYNTPYIPSIPGINNFPGEIFHSRNFRRPEEFTGKKVLLVGASASAVDISVQLKPYVKGELLQVIRSPSDGFFPISEGVKVVPEIKELHQDGSISFVDGQREEGVEVVLFATGYLYTVPFLPKELGLVMNGERLHGVYQQVIYPRDPTLSFIGLSTRVIPFPMEQSQAVWVAAVLSGQVGLPEREAMEKWEQEEEAEKGAGREFHFMGYPADADYLDKLEGFVGEAKGLEPTRWRCWERFVRERVPEIKKAFVIAKKEGRVVRTIEELGFGYEEQKEEKEEKEAVEVRS